MPECGPRAPPIPDAPHPGGGILLPSSWERVWRCEARPSGCLSSPIPLGPALSPPGADSCPLRLVLIRRPSRALCPLPGLLRGAAGAGVFLLYSLLMQPLGFGASTAAAVAGLGLLFGGPPRRVLVVGLVTTALLWFLFVPLLGIPLPMGWLFTGGRG